MAVLPTCLNSRPALRPGAQIGNTCASRFPMNSGTRPLTSAGVIRFPLDEGEWQDAEDSEIVAEGASEIVVRAQALPLPAPDEYTDHGIELERPPRVQVFELCRFLADAARDQVLATPQERWVNVPHRAGCAFQSMPFALFLNQRLITEGTRLMLEP